VDITIEHVIRFFSLCTWKWRGERRRPWRVTAEQTGRELIEQRTLPIFLGAHSIRFGELPVHLQTMALFKLNIRCYKQEMCKLRWY